MGKKRNVCLFVLASSFVLTSIILIGIWAAYQTQTTELQQYPGNEEISQIMENISASLAGVANSSIETVGLSVENNPIRLLRISPSVGAGPDSQVNNSCRAVLLSGWSVVFTLENGSHRSLAWKLSRISETFFSISLEAPRTRF